MTAMHISRFTGFVRIHGKTLGIKYKHLTSVKRICPVLATIINGYDELLQLD